VGLLKLLVVGPHPQDFYSMFGLVDLVDEAVFDIDAPGISAKEISHEPFVRMGILKRIRA